MVHQWVEQDKRDTYVPRGGNHENSKNRYSCFTLSQASVRCFPDIRSIWTIVVYTQCPFCTGYNRAGLKKQERTLDSSSKWNSSHRVIVKMLALTLFIPGKNRKGKRIAWFRRRQWQHRAMVEITKLYGGTTSYKSYGKWQNSVGEIIDGSGYVVWAFLESHDVDNTDKLDSIKSLCRKMQQALDQEDIGLRLCNDWVDIHEPNSCTAPSTLGESTSTTTASAQIYNLKPA